MIPQYQKGWTPSFCPSSPIYRRKEGGGCRPARPSELGCFHQKPPPSFWNLHEGPSGPDCYFTPLFTKYTHFCIFLLISFRNIAELLRITQWYYFWLPECSETLWITQQCSFWLSKCFGTLQITQQRSFWLPECCGTFTDYATTLFFGVPKGTKKVRKPTASVPGQN